jgi:RNA polymerase sigma-70 factor (ECF subfamily)
MNFATLGLDELGCYQAKPMGKSALSGSSLANAALEQLDALYRLARRLTDSPTMAEDLVQETYARALGAAQSFESGTNLRAWLFRILRNAHIDSVRRERNKPVATGFDEEELTADAGELLRGDRELDLLKKVVSSDIERALQSLSIDARTIVLLDLEGFTESELSEVLGCAIGTIKSRLARARVMLRDRLCDYAR